jgi:hypothetical protein
MENALRNAGVVVMAISFPFVLVFLLLHWAASLIAPDYMYRRGAARREHLDQIRTWQREQLTLLRARPYKDLVALPLRSELEPPTHLKREHLAIIRAPGENGGVEIGVAHFQRFLFITGRIMPSFEMLADGTIVEEPSDERDD